MKNPIIFLLFLNGAFYIAGYFLAKGINFFAKRELVKSRILGTICVLALSGFLLTHALTGISRMSATVASSGSDTFLRSAAMGGLFWLAVIPGLLVLLVAGLIEKSKNASKISKDKQIPSDNSKPKKRLSEKIATGIFWTFSGIILLLALASAITRL